MNGLFRGTNTHCVGVELVELWRRGEGKEEERRGGEGRGWEGRGGEGRGWEERGGE